MPRVLGRRAIPTAALAKAKRKATRLAREPSLDFFDLAVRLSELHDGGRTALKKMESSTGLPRRRMYYLVEVGDLIRKYAIPKAQADEVGWTKLQIVARHLKKSHPPSGLNELLEIASANKALALRRLLQGKNDAGTKAVQFELNAKARANLDKALLAFGAKPAGRGLIKRDAALLRIIRAAMENKG